MEIRVEGSLDQAMRVLKRKLAKEGVFKEMKKQVPQKPSVRRKRKRSEAQRRRRKEQRAVAHPQCNFQ